MGWALTHIGTMLPVDHLHETRTLLAFRHPKPSYPTHILLVPKRPIGGLMDLGEDDHEFLQDVFSAAQNLVSELALGAGGYRLVLNGGDFQDFPYLHFHLVSGEPDRIE